MLISSSLAILPLATPGVWHATHQQGSYLQLAGMWRGETGGSDRFSTAFGPLKSTPIEVDISVLHAEQASPAGVVIASARRCWELFEDC
jgi:hypothetical protein